jgi:elongation factor G
LKEYKGEQICNIAVAGHSGTGKTSLVEAMLYSMHETTRLGHIEQGNTVSDYLEDEIEHQISIGSSLVHGEWQGKKLNVIDTPGFSDFFGEEISGIWAADTAMIIVSAASSVEIGTEIAWELAEKYKKARFFVVNKEDKSNVDFDQVYADLEEAFGSKVVLMEFPLESGPQFHTIVDVLKRKVFTYNQDESGKYTESEVPADLKEKVEALHTKFVETIAESNDELIEKYLETGDLTETELLVTFRQALINQSIAPVFCTAGRSNIGIANLLDFITTYLPSPLENESFGLEDGSTVKCSEDGPFVASVFKTVSEQHVGELSFIRVISGSLKHGDEVMNSTRNTNERISQIYVLNGKNKQMVNILHAGDIGTLVKLKSTHTNDTLCSKDKKITLAPIEFPETVVSIAVSPKKQGDENKIANGLHIMHEEDPTFVKFYDPELKQTIISGLGELHLEIVIKRLKQRFGVDVDVTTPKVPYRETIRAKAEAQGKYKKQTGGHGQYGDCFLRIESLERGNGFEFVDAVVGGAIPGKYIPAVEKGVLEAMKEGILAGYPVVDVKVTCFHGSYHTVDSSELAFKMAGSMAFKKAFLDSKPVLLEPIYEISVKVPEQYMGEVMGNLSGRRGKILGTEADSKFETIKALVPLAELHKYSTDLRSMTQGKGAFSRKFSHYEEIPPELASKTIDLANKSKEKA